MSWRVRGCDELEKQLKLPGGLEHASRIFKLSQCQSTRDIRRSGLPSTGSLRCGRGTRSDGHFHNLGSDTSPMAEQGRAHASLLGFPR